MAKYPPGGAEQEKCHSIMKTVFSVQLKGTETIDFEQAGATKPA